MRNAIGIEFHSLGVVYKYDISNKEERDIGTANAPLTNDHSVRLWVSATGLSKSVIYLGVKLFMAMYVKMALLYFFRFTICRQLNSLNISADGVLKYACDFIRTARYWSSDILSRFDEDAVPNTTDP